MSLQLAIIAGPDAGRTFTLQAGPNQMLGRGTSSLYHLTDPRVSRSHAQVLLEGDTAVLICNSGSGGTFVNGKKISRQPLKPGDVVQVGDTQLRLVIGDFSQEDVKRLIDQTAPARPAAPPAAKIGQLTALSGKTLGHYDIGPVIGTGHAGIVFHATDTKDDRPVALKVLQPEFSKDDEEMRRFIRAIKTTMPLRHPNLITIYGAGKTAGYCWVAMEFIAGENLMQVIERIGVAGMLDWRYGFKVCQQIGQALEYAHDQDIIHRNVTPTNILLDAPSKVFKLGDLTLAKALEGTLAQQITKPGELIGDVAYMSPERTRGTDDLDGRSDLYGLGATVYALLTGRPPFDGSSLIEKVSKIRTAVPEKPTKFQLAIPHRFEGVVLKLLARKPEDRYQSAGEMLAELNKIGKIHNVTS
jgi:serine/threonine protein kinase